MESYSISEALAQYRRLEFMLLLTRSLHPDGSVQEDAILDRMDAAWLQLTASEREQLNSEGPCDWAESGLVDFDAFLSGTAPVRKEKK